MFLNKEFLKEVIGPYVIKVVVGFLVVVVGLSIAFGHGVAYTCVVLGRIGLVKSVITPMNLYLPVAVGGVVLTGLGFAVMYRGFKDGVRWLEGRLE